MNPIWILLDLEESGAITRKEGQDILRKAYLELGGRRYKPLIEKNWPEDEENLEEEDLCPHNELSLFCNECQGVYDEP